MPRLPLTYQCPRWTALDGARTLATQPALHHLLGQHATRQAMPTQDQALCRTPTLRYKEVFLGGGHEGRLSLGFRGNMTGVLSWERRFRLVGALLVHPRPSQSHILAYGAKAPTLGLGEAVWPPELEFGCRGCSRLQVHPIRWEWTTPPGRTACFCSETR